MGKLARFLKLERARPVDDDPAHPGSPSGGRFAKLEPRHEAAQEAAADPFMPKPEREVALEVAHDAAPAADKAKAERRARAEADLASAREVALARQAALDEAQPELATRALDTLVRMTNAHRWTVLGGGAVAIGIAAMIFGPTAWGLLAILLGVVIGSAYGAKDA
ncbi:MAG: hypothetical protein H0T42_10565 [Deltaproteobacteria bacterium]|nr:hypothetical protein [Deltaproteobacteria bacterium]